MRRVSWSISGRAQTLRQGVAIVGVVGACGAFAVTPAAANQPQQGTTQEEAQAASQGTTQTTVTGIKAVDGLINTITDGLHAEEQNGAGAGAGTGAATFAAEGHDVDAMLLGYAARKKVSRHPLRSIPTSRPASPVRYAIWGQVFVDREWRDQFFLGADLGRTTTTVGGVFGVDAVIRGIGTQTGALVLGLLGGDISTRVRNNDGSTVDVSGPSIGGYAAYVNGPASVNVVYKVDFFHLTKPAFGAATALDIHMDSHAFVINFNYRLNMSIWFPGMNNWWIEPTVGLIKTHLDWAADARALGFIDADEVRLQGGARAGTSFNWNNVKVEPTVAAIAYSPVDIQGGTVATVVAAAPAAPNDMGKVFGQFTGKLNFQWASYFSSYVEGEVRGREGVLGAAGRLGARYQFQ